MSFYKPDHGFRALKISAIALVMSGGLSTSDAISQGSLEQASAQSGAAQNNATRLITLGTGGGPVPRIRRAASANLLQVGDRTYLIDAGSGASVQLARAGMKQGVVKRVFLTHLHYDHTGGLADLIAYTWGTRPDGPIEIYGPPATGKLVADTITYLDIPLGIFVPQMPPIAPVASIVEAHDIDVSAPTMIYRDDIVRVIAAENSHYSTIASGHRPPGAARSYSYRFDTPDRSFVFTGDTGPSAAVEKLAAGADVLVSEVMDPAGIASALALLDAEPDQLKAAIDHLKEEHLSPEQVGLLAARAGVKLVILSHIGPGKDDENDFRNYTAGVRRHFDGPVVIAGDGDEF